jgi:hypothetical protein
MSLTKRPKDMTKAELVRYVARLKGMIRTLQETLRKIIGRKQ